MSSVTTKMAASRSRATEPPLSVRLTTRGFLLVAALATLLPFLWVFVTSLKLLRDINVGGLVFQPTSLNYVSLFTGESHFRRYILNSLVVAIGATTLALLISVPAAYSLARFRWPKLVGAVMLGWVLLIHAVPPVTLAAPFFVIMHILNLYDTLLGLTLAHVVLCMPIVVWLMHGFFVDLPTELEEASRVDGCNRYGTFVKVSLPLVRPGIAAAAMLSFMVSWNEFLFAITLTATPNAQTIPVGLALLVQDYTIRYGQMAAGAVIATIPAVILVALAQRHLVQGLTLGALKG
ncbi:MAG: carbohydrate ABC transporter permease [Chloroflexota bacterium]